MLYWFNKVKKLKFIVDIFLFIFFVIYLVIGLVWGFREVKEEIIKRLELKWWIGCNFSILGLGLIVIIYVCVWMVCNGDFVLVKVLLKLEFCFLVISMIMIFVWVEGMFFNKVMVVFKLWLIFFELLISESLFILVLNVCMVEWLLNFIVSCVKLL